MLDVAGWPHAEVWTVPCPPDPVAGHHDLHRRPHSSSYRVAIIVRSPLWGSCVVLGWATQCRRGWATQLSPLAFTGLATRTSVPATKTEGNRGARRSVQERSEPDLQRPFCWGLTGSSSSVAEVRRASPSRCNRVRLILRPLTDTRAYVGPGVRASIRGNVWSYVWHYDRPERRLDRRP
jgi:hypothetical protein